MANEDVNELLELADAWKRGVRSGGRSTGKLIDQLAAALREAREDTKRLARAARLVVEIDGDYCACIRVPDELPYRCLTCLLKEEIDAAMKPPGGERTDGE